jgi:hypothetical protein
MLTIDVSALNRFDQSIAAAFNRNNRTVGVLLNGVPVHRRPGSLCNPAFFQTCREDRITVQGPIKIGGIRKPA